MEKNIDCLLIGHNEVPFVDYEKTIRKMGVNSGAYRDLNLNFLNFNNHPYSAPEIFNLFCYPPAPPSSNDVVKPLRSGEWFSAAIAYLGTYLHRRGFTFDYVNSFQDQKDELAEKLSRENIITVAITTTLYVSLFPVIEIVELVRKYNKTAKIIVGGPFISTQVRLQSGAALDYLFKQLGADLYVNSSQGEATLVKILHALKNNLPLDPIPNIYFMAGNGWNAAPLSRENNSLSENMVNWDLFTAGIDALAYVRTAISCLFSCAFCGFPEHAGKYRNAGIDAVERELDGLAKIETIKFVFFTDDTFNVPINRFKEMMRMMIKNRYHFKWSCHLRCQFVDREMVELMKESGCEGVLLGIESGSNQILQNMNKKVKVEEYHKGIALLGKYGLITHGSFVIGFPGETHETLRETITFIKESGLDFYRAQLWYCERITPIWKQSEKYGLRGSNFEWSHKTMNSKEACDIVDEVFLSGENPTWVPQYNFEFEGIFSLLHREIPLEKVKKFLQSFKLGIREKLLAPSRKELSHKVIRQLKEVGGETLCGNGSFARERERPFIETRDAQFDF